MVGGALHPQLAGLVHRSGEHDHRPRRQVQLAGGKRQRRGAGGLEGGGNRPFRHGEDLRDPVQVGFLLLRQMVVSQGDPGQGVEVLAMQGHHLVVGDSE